MSTTSGPNGRPKSLLDGVERVACELLGITSSRHRSALLKLGVVNGTALVEALFRQIRTNYDTGGASDRKNRSRKNWRWQCPQLQIAANNKSREVVVERAIVAACVRLGCKDWSNQVPVASGLIEGAGGGRRAIDLVHLKGERHFEFIELKIASDTPLYAAIEIIGYGCLWIIARGDPPADSRILLKADQIDLRVLAPDSYYRPYNQSHLGSALNAGVIALGQRHDVSLSFAFEQLDERIQPEAMPDDEGLFSNLEHRSRSSRMH